MKVVLHGKLRKLFGESFEIATSVPADAIEGVSRQCESWPKTMLIDCVGFETKESLFADTEVEEIHLVPSINGGGAVGKIIIGAALIAFALFNPLGIASAMVLSAIMSVGVAIAMAGVMQLFYKSPSLHKSDDPPASKYLGTQGNTTAIGTYRYIGYGRAKIYGHWLSMQVDARSIILGRFPTTAPA